MKQCPFCAEDIQDAAIVCKHCGRDLTPNAPTPPPRPTKKPMGPLGVGCLLVLTVMILGVVAGQCQRSSSMPSGSSPTPAPAALEARVTFDGVQLTVKNEGATDWLDVRCVLNRSGFFAHGFEYRVKRLDAGQSFKVSARQFTLEDGTRFDPIRTKPTSMAISAKIDSLNGTEAFYYGAWQ